MYKRITYPLTHPQQRIWYTDKLYPGTSMWNNTGSLKIKGILDYDLLRQAVLIFIQDNPSLRLQIIEEDGRPFQYISDYIPDQIDFVDLSGQGMQALYKWDSSKSQENIKLIDSPLYYIAVLKLSDNEGCLFAKIHHIISDALSMVSFSGSIMKCYDMLLNGIQPQPGEFKRGNYLDFIAEEISYLESPRRENDRIFWLDKFNDLSEPTVIKPRPASQGTRAKRKTFILDNKTCSRVRSFCTENRISEFTLFLSALSIYINRTSGKKDIVINTPVYNRTNRTNKNAFGMFVSTVPLRLEIQDELSFTQFAQGISDIWFSSLKHQKYPYDMLLNELRKNKGINDAPSDITLSFQTAMFEKINGLFSYEGRWHFSGHQAGALNIHLNDRDSGGLYIMDYDFLSPMFSVKEIEYIHLHLMVIIEDIIANPEKPLYSIDILTPEEKERILVQFNDTYHYFPENQTLTQVWRDWVNENPESIAIICGGEKYTYYDIDAQARALAVKLKQLGVGPETVVAVMMNRSAQVVAAELGILMAGGAFLPIDADLPIERVLYMIEDSGANILVTTSQLATRYTEQSTVVLLADELEETDIIPEIINSSTDLAYIIYTSGSTGKPKGVMIEHGMLLHYINSASSILHYTKGYNTLCASSISFDGSILEIYSSLMNGGTLVMAMEHQVSIPSNMVELIRSAGVNEMLLTPGRLELLLSDPGAGDCLKNFADITMGGDVLPTVLLERLRKQTEAKLYNFYGPTEITIAATYKDVTTSKDVNIGRPLKNVKTYILDKFLNPVPIGVMGELYIGGKGVARGYINNPELTQQRFIANPFCKGERIYKTGDLTRYFPLGEIEFLGRSDNQIKLRGFRVELGEIEEHIKRIPGVGMCAVCAFDDASGRKSLCAYICGDNITSIAEIKSILARELPSYMVPGYYTFMDNMPLNNSGKIDRLRLPKPETNNLLLNGELPITETEQKIAAIWSELLNINQVGRNESFFDLGGDSLAIVQCVSLIKSRLGYQINLEELYRNPTIANCALIADMSLQTTDFIIHPAPKKRSYPASSTQKRMYAINKSKPDNLSYNIPMLFLLNTLPNINKLEKTFKKLIERHEIFRTSLCEQKGEIVQIVRHKVKFTINHIHCKENLVKKTARELVVPFDLSQVPLIRVTIISADKEYLLIDMHHCVSDLQTIKLIFTEMDIIYKGDIPPLTSLQYKDYAFWQYNWLKNAESKIQREFWKNHLSGEIPVLNLPYSGIRGVKRSYKGKEENFRLSIDVTNKLRVIARAYGATMFMIVLAAYNVLLSKYSGAEDIIVAIPHHGRTYRDLDKTAGMFVGTLPIRYKPVGEKTFEQFLNDVKENCADAFASSNYPLEEIISGLDIIRDPSRNLLFDTMLSYQSGTDETIAIGELKLKPIKIQTNTSKLDLTLEISDTSNGLDCRFEYDSSVFSAQDIKRMSKSYTILINTLTEKLDAKISELSVVSEEDNERIKFCLNGAQKDIEGDITGTFERTVSQYPDKTALIANDGFLSFSQLNKKSNAIALTLLKSGIKQGDIIAVAVKRTSGLIASIIGILKAGGAYLPIDLMYPSDRIAFMLSDSGVKTVILDNNKDTDIHFAGKRLYLDEIGEEENNPVSSAAACDPSYVIYTSGSTGIPKGVVLTREGLYNLYVGSREPVGYSPELTAISLTTASFDIFIAETLLPLLNGCSVVLCDEEQMRLPQLTAALIEEHSASFLQTTPTRLSFMMTNVAFRKALSCIKLILCGGEKCTSELVRSLHRYTDAKIVNGYAPSETTVYSTFSEIKNANRITIGRPIQNTILHILDKYGQPVPFGVQGEAYIGGAGVGIGYINRFELTEERFLPDPFCPGGKMYRTGDICSLNSDGEIVIHGRSDDQIKLRGQRIELGEIEACAKSCPGVSDAVIKYFPDDSGFLCCYYIVSRSVDETVLRTHLAKKLPVFMIPSNFVKLKVFPTTPSGKVDRKALPYPHKQTSNSKKVPMTQTERQMANIWSKVLKVKNISVNDNFFDLGGDSLSVIKVQAAMYARGLSVNTRDFYALRTLGRISGACGRKESDTVIIPMQKKTVSDKPHVAIKLNKVLLTGATGYAGAHILAELVDNYDSEVYCLVRGIDYVNAQNALYNTLCFYFGNKADKYMKRVLILNGDISIPGLGINESEDKLSDISCLIHSAALTSHVGSASDFEKINIKGTINIADFCKKLEIPLLYISTMSVSGTHHLCAEAENIMFDESCYYIGQNYDSNDYVKSKFLAEGILLDEAEEGLDVLIFRAGNLTSRYKDGVFQKNPTKNAFARAISTISMLGVISTDMLDSQIEMTPVDLFASAILSLAASGGNNNRIYHFYNPNTIKCINLVDGLRGCGFNINEISRNEFERKIKHVLRSGNQPAALSIIKELTDERQSRGVHQDATITCELLANLGFIWPQINNNYIETYINKFIHIKNMI
ncbi:MAG: amino acid adenylation domain-containing protein [Eubacteriales bacterium]